MINKLKNKLIYVDTAPFIQFIEASNEYSKILEKIFKLSDNTQTMFYTSVITLLEVMVLPYQNNNKKLIETYKNILLNSKNLNISNIDANSLKNTIGNTTILCNLFRL